MNFDKGLPLPTQRLERINSEYCRDIWKILSSTKNRPQVNPDHKEGRVSMLQSFRLVLKPRILTHRPIELRAGSQRTYLIEGKNQSNQPITLVEFDRAKREVEEDPSLQTRSSYHRVRDIGDDAGEDIYTRGIMCVRRLPPGVVRRKTMPLLFDRKRRR